MQFIYSNPRALSSDYCNELIDLFEQSPLKQRGQFRLKDEIVERPDVKSSTDITFTPNFLQDPQWGPYLQHLVTVVEENLVNYTFRFKQAFEKVDDFRIDNAFNMQKYAPGEGFYGWHCERAGLLNSNRVLVWMVYLNNVNDGGQTQFFHQGHLEKPTQGKLLIWPSDWTHTHRGVPSPTENKYILTGWFTHYKND